MADPEIARLSVSRGHTVQRLSFVGGVLQTALFILLT